MKRFIGIIALAVVVTFFGQSASAQKFGHIDNDQLIQALPEFDTARVQLEKFQKELVNALELMSVEFNNKREAYQKDAANLSEIVKQNKEQELSDLQGRIQEFQQNAQQQLQNKQAELFQPIVTKVDKAVKEVGKENGFIYIFDVSQSKASLLYFDETKSTNVTPLVKTKLGIK